jgi:opacity protein-like surface antigen
MSRPGAVLLIVLTLVLLLFTRTSSAEWYVGGYGGLSYPGAFTNVTINDPFLNGGIRDARVNDLELHISPVGGVKVGYMFADRPWLGIEADVFTLKPDVKQQDVVGGKARGPAFVDTLRGIPLRVTTMAANIIIRSPSMSDVFEPYAGMGYAIFLANSSQGGESNLHVSHGFNLVAGARYTLTENWALFGEFKYNRATLRFSDIRGNYDTQLFVLGIVWHSSK